MKMLEIDENDFINLNKVIRVKIKDNNLTTNSFPNYGDPPETIISGYRLEFELDKSIIVKSKSFETIEEAKMWLYDHTK